MDNNGKAINKYLVDEDKKNKQYGTLLEPDANTNISSGLRSAESLLSLSSGSSNELFSLAKFNEGCKSKSNQVSKNKYGDFVRLLVASVLALSFLFIELIGAYYSSSVALYYMTAHTACDVIGYLTCMSTSLPTTEKRKELNKIRKTELIGFLTGCILSWSTAGALLFAAFQRLKGYGYKLLSEVMVSVSVLGLMNSMLNGILFHGCEEDCGGPYGKTKPHRLLLSTTKLHTTADVIISACIVIASIIIQVSIKCKSADAIVTIIAVIGSLITNMICMRDAVKIICKEESPRLLLKSTSHLLSMA